MPRPTILVAFGTRPEAIKLAPVIRELKRRPEIRTRVCVTAQHRQMLDQMLADFGLRPDDDLNLMQENQGLAGFSARALIRLQAVLKKERPALLLVQGDTTTTFIASLAAFYERVPVGHVEAGLRSFDRNNPYPEEINRILTDRLSELHFAPTAEAKRNLLAEGLRAADVFVTGNTVVDALQWAAARQHRFREPRLASAVAALGPDDRAVLVTTHRRENLEAPLEGLCRAFRRLVQSHPELHLFYPVHPNPKVERAVRTLVRHPRAHLLPPLGYFDLVHLFKRCAFALTDSGGLQEEAAGLGVPVLVLRRVTERPEVVRAGVAKIAGTEPGAVFQLASRLLRDEKLRSSMARRVPVYGDGRASKRIVDATLHRLGISRPRPAEFGTLRSVPARYAQDRRRPRV